MEPLMTTEEIAEYLRVEVVTVRRLVSRGELPAYRVGGEFRFTAQEIQDFIKRQRVGGIVAEMRDYYDNFTERARLALNYAQLEAEALGHVYIGTEHLLLSLTIEGEGLAAQALIRAGLNLEDVRQQTLDLLDELKRQGQESATGQIKAAITAIKGAGREGNPPGERPLTPRSKKVIELAVYEARRMKHNYIGTEHLLLGMLKEGEGLAAGVLIDKCGLHFEPMRNLVLQILQEPSPRVLPEIPEQAATLLSADEQGVMCGRCSARSPDYFRYCFHCGLKFPDNT